MALRVVTTTSVKPKELHDKLVILLKKTIGFPFDTDRLDVDESGYITFGYKNECGNRVWLRLNENESEENTLVYSFIGPRDPKLTVTEYACIFAEVSRILLEKFSNDIKEIDIKNFMEEGFDYW